MTSLPSPALLASTVLLAAKAYAAVAKAMITSTRTNIFEERNIIFTPFEKLF
jgi:hypothetical protein